MRLEVLPIMISSLMIVAAPPDSPRGWTDSTGEYSVEATLVEIEEDSVVLKKAGGDVITVPITRLSEADRRYLEGLSKPGPTQPAGGSGVEESAPLEPGSVRMSAASVNAGETIPVAGRESRNVEVIDEIMLKYMRMINCSTASIAISEEGKLLVSRGYGWVDKERTRPAPSDVMIGLASCKKPIVSASVKHLFQTKGMNLDTPLLEFFEVVPAGEVVDRRVFDITIRHLTQHKAGWGTDPRRHLKNMNFRDMQDLRRVLSHIATRSLESTPGSKKAYCNFGFLILRDVINEVSGSHAAEYAAKRLPGIDDHFTYNESENLKTGRAVWNASLYAASTPTLCSFMRSYWIDGEPRRGEKKSFAKYGSWPNSTSLMIWLSDGTNIAVTFNGRGGGASHRAIQEDIVSVLDDVL
jgi:hypothetical protein